jgi:hypothetical protein
MDGSGSPSAKDALSRGKPAVAKPGTPRELAITLGIAVVLFGIVAGLTLAAFAGGPPQTPISKLASGTQAQVSSAPTQAATSVPATTATPAQSPTQYKSAAKAVSVADIASNPNAYLGVDITFQGQVIGLLHNSTGAVAGVNLADPKDASAIMQVNFSPYVVLDKVHVNDTLTIWGQGTGSFISVNGAGKSLSEGAANELYLHDATSGYDDNTITDPQSYISGSG